MEQQNQGTIRPKHKRKSSNKSMKSETIFALMLASLHATSSSSPTFANPNKKQRKKTDSRRPNSYHHHHQLQLQLLTQLRLSLLSKTHNSPPLFPNLTLPLPILSLLPLLLTSKYAEVVCKCAEFVGVAALFSLEMNEQIAGDDETVKGLIFALSSSNGRRSSSIAACNAVLDMATTSFGRQRLVESSFLECLISVCGCNRPVGSWLENGYMDSSVYEVCRNSQALVCLSNEERGIEARLRIGFEEDELPVSLLDASIMLINACSTENLEKIPKKLSESLLAYLKKFWTKVRSQMLLCTNTILKHSQESHSCVSNFSTNNLAESIFRLSVSVDKLTTPLHMDVVKRCIFSRDGSGFENFIENNWEVSPMLIGKFSSGLNEGTDIFGSFRQSLDFNEAFPSFLSTILKNLVSCPPIASDELDILHFLKEMKNQLGCPMMYKQDIRVLKAQNLKREVHFFQDSQFLIMDDILRCNEAYEEGYTIALRGMEFRVGSIADLVDGLAYLFGQPSAGVNMYLTPPNSQGLACHRDDHCVFVCQLVGVKKWTVFRPKTLRLPRLYETVENTHEAATLALDESEQFFLREGDVLYIPRGFPHEACTVVDNDRPNETAELSLHLTLAIEVEPPFEWEGFAHVALHNWNQNQKQSSSTSCDSLCGSLNAISVILMRVAIKLIGDSDPTFRKACLVGAISLLSDSEGWLDLNQRSIFSHLIKSIDAKSSFSDALRNVTMSLQENEDPLQQIRWLQHLGNDEQVIEVQEWSIPSIEQLQPLVLFCHDHKDEAEAAFMEVKCKFCSEAAFEDVEKCYKILLGKYRKVRKQYTSGMLSLHCN
ncbi:hypothetical protein RHSIM_Rhsim01G0007900 [Rhododendron simsii]|uniref:Bifunctional lysine-specific demethylase and histidyl-hydroxylase n=1 Tax=Rhododendron simsii TaxID=118357 RepID=A0A834HMI2_RHOSS|nr:hypothetical protein RHSIM_Rhsim01G0007900 [Rhododendron simsii]